MKSLKIFLPLAAIAFATPSFAADIPMRKATSGGTSSAMFDWSGFYAGLNGGYGFGRYEETLSTAGIEVFSEPIKVNGGFAGGQIGFNHQTGSIVWGVEADIQKSWMNGSKSFFIGETLSVDLELDWFATLRGRLGYASGPSLFYFTGGLIHGRGTGTASILGVSSSSNGSNTGWTIGGGYEAAFGQNWTWRFEYLYADFGKERSEIGGLGLMLENRHNAHLVRFGTNYRFGS